MNPYLEQQGVWHDFHQRFAPALSDAIVPHLRGKYIARIDTEVYIHTLSDDGRLAGRPDVYVATQRSSDRRSAPLAAATATSQPAPAYATTPTLIDEIALPYIRIEDVNERQVVTIIELLSPTNKLESDDRAAYIAKRERLFRSRAHFVEIDLLRGGQRMPMNGLADSDYCVLVSRAEERPRVGAWTFDLSDPLPALRIPLLAGDPDVEVDLRRLLDRIYDAAGYADYIYAARPHPALSKRDAAWAREFVPADAG